MTKRTTVVIAAAAALTLAGSGWWAALAQDNGAPAPAEPTAVATVDVVQVLQQLDEMAAIQAEVKRQQEAAQAYRDQVEQEVNALRPDLERFKPGSENWEASKAKIDRKLVELQVEIELRGRQAVEYQTRSRAAVYRKLCDASAAIAKAGGYDMVVFAEPLPDFQGVNPQQLLGVIQQRKVLWSDPALDISPQVILRMNNAFKAAGGNAGAGG